MSSRAFDKWGLSPAHLAKIRCMLQNELGQLLCIERIGELSILRIIGPSAANQKFPEEREQTKNEVFCKRLQLAGMAIA